MRKIFIVTLLCGLACWSIVTAQPVRQYLYEDWEFRQARGVNWYPAKIPGTVHTDLMNNRLIEDPFFRLNERGVQWVDKEDWIYRTSFDLTLEVWGKSNIVLRFNGLDTYADVTLNGKKLFSADNMFREWQADVKSLLKEKGNELQIYFHSPIKIAMPQWEKLPFQYRSSNDQSENGGLFDRKVGVFVRKAGYHFGWDWGPRLVTSGIWRPVFLEAWDDMRINNVFYQQLSVSAQKASLQVSIEILSDKEKFANVSVRNRTDDRIEAEQTIRLQKGMNKIQLPFTIKSPHLWWSNGLGNPFLYEFAAVLKTDDCVKDVVREHIGIRSLRVVTKPDKQGESFYFELNGVPVFAKGTNYIPAHSFLPGVTRTDYEKIVKDAAFVHMNMIRVWGGGVYEDDAFYELCDRYGILVWQDFMFACALFPAEGEWLENVRREAVDNVRRLRNHPCIALWCGNNECLDAWFNWNWKNAYDKQNPAYSELIWKQFKNLYFVALPAVVAEHHPGACYRKSSPYADDQGTRNHAVGDMHYWDVWKGLEPLTEFAFEQSRFFSEYGFQSFPEFESIKQYAPLPEDWQVNSEVMMSHQRGGIQANQRINDFLLSDYHAPKDFQSFTYLSQLLQGDVIKMAMEAHRRNKPYCMGSLVWQHNDCWPVASWSSRDFYGRWKAQHYFTKKAFDDLLVSPFQEEGKLKIWAVSDRLNRALGRLTVRVVRLDGQGDILTRAKRVAIPANTSTVVWEEELDELLHNMASPEEVVVNVTFSDDKGRLYANNYFLVPQKELKYHPAGITKEVKQVPGGYEITLACDVFARGVFLSIKDDITNFFTDNYVDLLPDEPLTIRVMTNLSEKDFLERLQIRSFTDAVAL